jgi:hypothetical protein
VPADSKPVKVPPARPVAKEEIPSQSDVLIGIRGAALSDGLHTPVLKLTEPRQIGAMASKTLPDIRSLDISFQMGGFERKRTDVWRIPRDEGRVPNAVIRQV